jgi:hypothetical protein
MFFLSLVFSLLFTFPSIAKNGREGDAPFEVKKASYFAINVEDENKAVTVVIDPDSLAVSYNDTKLAANALRLRLQEDFRSGNISFDQVKEAFTHQLVNEIIPHWYGTPWSFGGHTTIPNQGKIACGYFISTTLNDMGINLNRFRLAQKSPLDEARMISCGAEIIKVVQEDSEKAWKEIDVLTSDGLYFIGFDEGHVGYLLKQEGELFLIHSNYLAPIAVHMETLKESRVFKKFSTFYVVPISHNDTLLKRWLAKEVVL